MNVSQTNKRFLSLV